MGLISRVKAERRTSVTAGTNLSSPDAWLLRMLGGHPTAAGVEIDEWRAMNISIAFACIRNIAEDVAKLPVAAFRDHGDSKEALPDEPAAILLNRAPNPESIPISFREAMTAHALSWGNGIADIEWYNNGRPAALWLQKPHQVSIVRDRAGRIVYEISNHQRQGGRSTSLYSEDVLHLHGLSFDGLVGYSVIRKARESLALTIAAERFGAGYFGNGAVPTGVLKHPAKLADRGEKLKKSWKEAHAEPGKRSIAVLEEGMEYQAIGIPPEDSQFLETRQFQLDEICRWYRMPPHKVMNLLRGTFSNIEHQSIEYVTDCLLPWIIRWEQECGRKLFGTSPRDARYIKHNVAALLRGDTESRYRGYAIGRQWGWLSVDDVLKLEDRNPLPNAQGAIYLAPSNMIPADKLGAKIDADIAAGKKAGDVAPPPPANPDNGNQNRADPGALLAMFRPVLEDALQRVMRSEADKVRRNAKRDDFAAWADKFYVEHRDHVRGEVFAFAETMASVAAANGRTNIAAGTVAKEIADRHVERSRREVRANGADAAAATMAAGVRASDQAEAEIAILKASLSAAGATEP